MQIGYVSETGRGASDVVLTRVAALLSAVEVRLAGTVQRNTDRPGRNQCDMDVQVLPHGPSIRISQDLGNYAKGCRLDSGALEQAVQAASQRLADADVLIVNKFGKLESEGRGFCSLIGEALDLGLPVLVGVNERSLPEFLRFSCDLAVPLGADPQEIVTWVLARRRQAASQTRHARKADLHPTAARLD